LEKNMNRRMVVLLIFLLVLVGIIIIGKQREEAIRIEQVERKAANELRRVAAEAQKARQRALEETRRIEAEAQRAKQEALEKARRAEEEAQKAKEMAEETVKQKAAEIQADINDLVAQATAFLDSGEYQKAIDIAQKILGLDPSSSEANSIIERATAMLKEVTGEAAETLTEDLEVSAEVPVAVPAAE
jgi:membrane protein involved in colicin uptake